MVKKIITTLLLTFIQGVLFWLSLFIYQKLFPLNKSDLSWGITLIYQLYFSVGSFLIVNSLLTTLKLNWKILAITSCILLLLSLIPISTSITYRPFKSVFVIILNLTFFASSIFLLKKPLKCKLNTHIN